MFKQLWESKIAELGKNFEGKDAKTQEFMLHMLKGEFAEMIKELYKTCGRDVEVEINIK